MSGVIDVRAPPAPDAFYFAFGADDVILIADMPSQVFPSSLDPAAIVAPGPRSVNSDRPAGSPHPDYDVTSRRRKPVTASVRKIRVYAALTVRPWRIPPQSTGKRKRPVKASQPFEGRYGWIACRLGI